MKAKKFLTQTAKKFKENQKKRDFFNNLSKIVNTDVELTTDQEYAIFNAVICVVESSDQKFTPLRLLEIATYINSCKQNPL